MRISAAFDWFKSGSLAADSDPYKILGVSRRAPADGRGARCPRR
jgi:hypothetical protein